MYVEVVIWSNLSMGEGISWPTPTQFAQISN